MSLLLTWKFLYLDVLCVCVCVCPLVSVCMCVCWCVCVGKYIWVNACAHESACGSERLKLGVLIIPHHTFVTAPSPHPESGAHQFG